MFQQQAIFFGDKSVPVHSRTAKKKPRHKIPIRIYTYKETFYI